MSNCTRLFGHKWGAWTTGWGGAQEDKSGRFIKQRLQRRECSVCHYIESRWVNEWELVESVNDTDEDKQ